MEQRSRIQQFFSITTPLLKKKIILGDGLQSVNGAVQMFPNQTLLLMEDHRK